MAMSITTRSLRTRRFARVRRPAAVRPRHDETAVPTLADLHLEVAGGECVAVVGADAQAREVLASGDPSRCGTLAVAGELRVTDDLDDAIERADRIAVLREGRIVHQVHLRGAHPRDLGSESLVTLRTRLDAALRA
jgi:hypothetical protein